MKRVGHLWETITSFDNLLAAAHESARGKRFSPQVASFHFSLERELFQIQRDLLAGVYQPGPYNEFYIFEPKQRLISAAPYRDRVVHHALTRVIGPVFERGFIFDSYACRKGKGTHAAVRRAQHFSKNSFYVLKADVQKFFPSIDHPILLKQVTRKIKDRKVLDLCEKIIAHSNRQERVETYFPGDDLFTQLDRRKGLPIGNQTSQFFANVYLDALDHFIRDELAPRGYVRYVDDFLIFSNSKTQLCECREAIREYLCRLRLKLHPRKCVISCCGNGIPFLGYRIFPTHRLLAKRNVRQFRRRLAKLIDRHATGKLSLQDLRCRISSWVGHASQANSYSLRSEILGSISLQG